MTITGVPALPAVVIGAGVAIRVAWLVAISTSQQTSDLEVGPVRGMANVVLYAATNWMLFRLVNRIGGMAASLGCIGLIAVWPSHVLLTGLATSDPVFGFLCLASLEAMAGSEERGAASAILAGLLNGLAMLVRKDVLLMPAFWLVYRLLGRTDRLRSVFDVSIATIAMAAVVLPTITLR
jgi:hypothetical protein